MKKILIKTVHLGFCLLLCGAAVLLSACGKSTDADTAAQPTAPAPSVSEKLSEEIKANWASWDAKSQLQQALSSTMPGSKSMYFWTWDNAVAYLGYSPWNPLEEAGFLEKMNTAGTPILPLGGDTLEHAVLRFQGDRDGSLTQISLQAGYSTADGIVRVILTADMILRPVGSGEAGKQISLNGSITGKETRDENDNYQAVNLYFERESVFYTIRLIAGKNTAESTALEETYALILALLRIRLGGSSTEEQMHTADPRENGVLENWDTLGLSESPEAVLESLMSENVVIQKDGGILSGRGLWEEFFEKTQKGEPASVLLVHYYTETNVRMALEYFETEYPKYPQCFLGRLDFDGTLCHYVVRKSDKAEIENDDDVTFRYLKCFTGEMPAQAVYDSFRHYVLINDESLTWDQLKGSLYSSSYVGNSAGFRMVVSEYFTGSGDFPDAYVPDEKERQHWWPQYGERGSERTYQRLEFSTNVQRELFPEAAADTQSLLALAEGDKILWRRELPYAPGNMISLKDGVAVSGTVRDEEALIPRTLYVERWGSDGERRWQWRAENPDALNWTLLAAQEENGGVRCLFHAYSYKKSLSLIKNLLFDEKGELISERQADIGTRWVFGGTLYGQEAILILPGFKPDEVFTLVRMDPEGGLSEAVALPQPEGEELSLDGIAVRDGKLYVSLTFRRRPSVPDSGAAAAGSWEDLAYGEIRPSEELTQGIRSQYRAELREAPLPPAGLPAAGQFRTVYGREESLGGRLSVDEAGVLCWDIREPFDLYPAPWADSFNIGGSCRILRYGYESEGVDWIMPTDRITSFRLLY